MGIGSSKSLLIVAKVELMKALVDQEEKLERQDRAETNLNQNTENYKGSEESRREERRRREKKGRRGEVLSGLPSGNCSPRGPAQVPRPGATTNQVT